MKKLLLFTGLPGVGKSTISSEFSKKTSARIVELDDFKKTDINPTLVRSQIDPPELRWIYYQKALLYVFELFDQRLPMIIMDEVFHLHSLRTRLETLCMGQHVQVLWIEVRCPYEVVEKRLYSTRRDGHILSTEETLRMHLRFKAVFEEFSIRSQNHIIINNENINDIDLAIEAILTKVKANSQPEPSL
ncbi:MAG: AAA family ATPase [Candidatus Moraniibacteriota bacterium]